jgi:ketosteroid isomerase-like protein
MQNMTRRGAVGGLGAVALAALSGTGVASAATAVADSAYPDPVLDGSHATRELTSLITSYLRDKTSLDVDRMMAHFNRDTTFYTDATIGFVTSGWTALRTAFAQLMATWGAGALSYPTRAIGDSRSAMVLFTDSPQLFGHELRIIAPVDFRDDKIVRQVDYWDGRHFGIAAIDQARVPTAQVPDDFGESVVTDQSSPVLREVVGALHAAFSAGDATAATALFTADAVFEDLTLHTRLAGPLTIGPYLDRSLAVLPYGPGTAIRHTVGGTQGGGYEWTKKGAPVDRGVIAIELDRQARISRLTTVWDGSLVDDATVTALLAATIER